MDDEDSSSKEKKKEEDEGWFENFGTKIKSKKDLYNYFEGRVIAEVEKEIKNKVVYKVFGCLFEKCPWKIKIGESPKFTVVWNE